MALASPAQGAGKHPAKRATDHNMGERQHSPPAHRDRIDIKPSRLELGGKVVVPTTTYNGQFPGPLLRLDQGVPVTIDIENSTGAPEQLHWHGQFISPLIDGAAEEGTPFIPANGRRKIVLTPQPSGLRYYHSHVVAGSDLSRGLYSGQAGVVYISPKRDEGAYDREVFLTLKEFGPYLSHDEMGSSFLYPANGARDLYLMDQEAVRAATKLGRRSGYEIAYRFHTINGKMLGYGAPIRVARGDRILLHVVNASATEIRSLALPGHTFRVLALDGNRVPRPGEVPVVWLGPGERISATVDMNRPGVWVLGDVDDHARALGMGVVVEYSGAAGRPQWRRQIRSRWDYRAFAKSEAKAREPDETIVLTIATRYSAQDGFNVFTINNEPFSMRTMRPKYNLRFGRRYRLRLRNATDDVHPIHLHRHSFELTSVAGKPTSGLIKDVIMIDAFQEMTIDFTADELGLSLFHCHMQHHMDFGFMALFDCQ